MSTQRVTLALGEVIQVYPGFWFCTLCSQPGRPGLGRSWGSEGGADLAYAAAAQHLRDFHGAVVT